MIISIQISKVQFFLGHPVDIVKILALALINLVLDLANLITNLTKSSLYLEKSGPGLAIQSNRQKPPPHQ